MILGPYLLLGWSLLNPLVQLPGAMMPAVAAWIVRKWVTREGFGDAGLRLRLREAWPQYLLALLGPPLVAGAMVVTAVLFGWYDWDTSELNESLGGVPLPVALLGLMALSIVLMPVFWGEEFGWTGYLRPRLLVGRPLLSLLLTSLLWALWHYPLAFTGYTDFDNVLVGLLCWTAIFFPLQALFTALYEHSGSIWVPSLAHAGNNFVLWALAGALMIDSGQLSSSTVNLVACIPLSLLAIWAWRSSPRHTGLPLETQPAR
nr:CPBP family glutamic-type intramembrane protease [Kineosporia babensis]